MAILITHITLTRDITNNLPFILHYSRYVMSLWQPSVSAPSPPKNVYIYIKRQNVTHALLTTNMH